MATKKRSTKAPAVEPNEQSDEQVIAATEAGTPEDVAATPAEEAPAPIAVKRRSRRAPIVISENVPDEETGPETLPILPLRNAVLFPMSGLPLEAAQPRSLRLIDAVVNGDRRVVFVAQKDKEVEGAGPNDLF